MKDMLNRIRNPKAPAFYPRSILEWGFFCPLPKNSFSPNPHPRRKLSIFFSPDPQQASNHQTKGDACF